MAFARNASWLFIARIIDGITAGNISVASAVISDTTKKEDRAKGFGIIGASFGLGFVFGPAISGLTYGINTSYPFLIAATISLVSFIATALFLPETNKDKKEMIRQKIFDLKKLFEPIFDKTIGKTLLISLLYSFAFSLFIYGFQPFAVKRLDLGITSISEIFTVIGIIGVIAQVAFIQPISKKLGDKKTLQFSLLGVVVVFILLGFSNSFYIFTGLIVLNSFINSFTSPILQTIISKEVHDDRQGEIMGINSSYVGLGQIFGPIAGGVMASISLSAPFEMASVVVLICLILSYF
jgi:predicted MFS family arabinose efflux permease